MTGTCRSRGALRATPRRPAFPAYLRPVTWPTMSTARPSPRPAPDAWPRWMRTAILRATRPPATPKRIMLARQHTSIDDLSPQAWNALEGTEVPFLRHEFLAALEHTGCVGDAGGWTPAYLPLHDPGG